jgi:hypothetical protein
MTHKHLRAVGLTIAAIGMATHVASAVQDFEYQAQSTTVLLLIWGCMPYFLALLLLLTIRRAFIPLIGVSGPMLFDVLNYYSLYIQRPTSTGGLNLLFVPFWNLFVIEPVGLLLGWLLTRWRAKKE